MAGARGVWRCAQRGAIAVIADGPDSGGEAVLPPVGVVGAARNRTRACAAVNRMVFMCLAVLMCLASVIINLR